MKKFTFITLFSTALLLSAPIVSFADQATNSETTTPIDPTTPVDPTTPGTTDPTTPVDPTTPGTTDPTTPGTTDPTTPGTTDPTTPGTTDPTTPGTTDPTTPGTTDPTTPGTTDPTTPVAPENPITTDGGHTVIGVDNSNPIIKTADGTIKTVSATEIGGTVNENGTVSIKDNDGKMKVLPKTGTKDSVLLAFFGGLMVLGSGIIFKKKNR